MVAGEISVTHYSCERRDYAFIVLQEYLIIFRFREREPNLFACLTFEREKML